MQLVGVTQHGIALPSNVIQAEHPLGDGVAHAAHNEVTRHAAATEVVAHPRARPVQHEADDEDAAVDAVFLLGHVGPECRHVLL